MKRWDLKRWKKLAALAVFSAFAGGCTRPLYMTPETHHLASTVPLPGGILNDPNVASPVDTSGSQPPATVLDSNREPRYLTLQEAIAIALEQGNIGNASAGGISTQGVGAGRGAALFNDDLVQFTGRGVQGDDSIRAFALDPAIAAADIEGALSKFDARFISSMSWQKQDQAVANIFNNFNNGDRAAFSMGMYKPLPTGGVAGITFETNYTRLGAAPAGFAVINPSYQPNLRFEIEQPLLQSFGVDINQLLPSHPGSVQIAGLQPSGGRAEGILVTRLRAEQSKSQFERELNTMVLNVEYAYWSLYADYFAKYAAEQAMRQSYITWEQLQQLLTAGLQTKQGVAQARAQFEQFRANYLTVLQRLLNSERQFRGLLGMKLEDGKRLVPADAPNLAPYKPDWNASLNEAINNRPELVMARQELKAQQFGVMIAQNATRPDLRAFANYSVNSIGNRLDGPGPQPIVDAQGQLTELPGNALGSLADNRFQSWNLGVRLNVPIGNRDAFAQLKSAQLSLARSHVVMKNQERKAEMFIGSVYQQLAQLYELIQIQRAQRIALGTQLEGQFERVKIGKDPLIQLLDAQQRFASAIEAEHVAIANYNIAIAAFQYAKGSILNYNNIAICDGALPTAVAGRAADHLAAKAAGLKLRERASEVTLPQDMGTAIPVPGTAADSTGLPLPETIMDASKPPVKFQPMPGSSTPAPIAPTAPPVTPKEMPKKTGPFVVGPSMAPPSLATPIPGLSPTESGPALPSTTLPSTPVSTFRPQQ